MKFKVEDLVCWEHHEKYLVDILNGVYDLDDARKDLRSLVGSKYDPRENVEAKNDRP